MNTSALFLHYVPIPASILVAGSTFTYRSIEDITVVAMLRAGALVPLNTAGGVHYHPAYLSAPVADFDFLRPGDSSAPVQVGSDVSEAQLVVLSSGSIAPVVIFDTPPPVTYQLVTVEHLGFTPVDYNGHRKVLRLTFSNGFSFEVAIPVTMADPAIGMDYFGYVMGPYDKEYYGQIKPTDG
jgi:hypothetical protein